jgi:hypothetical protein
MEYTVTQGINIKDVYDKPLNFLIGSGASYGLLPTLSLGIKSGDGKAHTLESLAAELTCEKRLGALFMHYYAHCVRPAQSFSLADIQKDVSKKNVIDNYISFLSTVLRILQRRKNSDTRCNIFTTNYDGCFAVSADHLMEQGAIDFVLNDGTRGFQKRYLQPRSFNSYLCQTGIFERTLGYVPQVNLIHLHGSVYWKKDGTSIVVDYRQQQQADLLSISLREKLAPFFEEVLNDASSSPTLSEPDVSIEEIETFWNAYKMLPIVNPTKWKFHETVFEEHYYHMLRMLSYELEKPNAVLITFGFSFADEHILSLVKRSLSNSSLQVFVCCFDEATADAMSNEFRLNRNVTCVKAVTGNLDFTTFNTSVFTLDEMATPSAATVAAEKLT